MKARQKLKNLRQKCRRIYGKSVLGACIKMGDEIELICEGTDEEEALEKMIQIIEDGLGE